MNSIRNIAEEVSRLQAEGLAKSKRDNDPLWAEFHAIYPAQDLLVRIGYEGNNPEIRDQFEELIPVNSVLKHRLETTLSDLYSRSDEVRLAAAEAVLAEVSGEFGIERQLWIRHPKCVETLLPSLEDDNHLVVKTMLYVMGHLFGRIADPRIIQGVQSFYSATNNSLIDAVIVASSGFDTPEKWGFVISKLNGCKNQKQLCLLFRSLDNAPTQLADQLFRLLVEIWDKRKLNAETSDELLSAIANTVCDGDLRHASEVLASCRKPGLRDALLGELQYYCGLTLEDATQLIDT